MELHQPERTGLCGIKNRQKMTKNTLTLHAMIHRERLFAFGTRSQLHPSPAMVLSPPLHVQPVEALLTEQIATMIAIEHLGTRNVGGWRFIIIWYFTLDE